MSDLKDDIRLLKEAHHREPTDVTAAAMRLVEQATARERRRNPMREWWWLTDSERYARAELAVFAAAAWRWVSCVIAAIAAVFVLFLMFRETAP